VTRVGIVGAGLGGSLLAWRLAVERPNWSVELIGPPTSADATAASGGLVRGFERDPVACRMAAASLAELRRSPALIDWSGYREATSLYVLRPTPAEDMAARLADVRRWLPGSVTTASAAELEQRHGWAGLPAGSIGVVEPRAGYFSPGRLRDGIMRELGELGVELICDQAERVGPGAGSGARVRVGSRERRYDLVVLATGRWTRRLLAASGLTAAGYRTKAIEYGIYEHEGCRPPAFIDDTSGLYGRPDGDGRVLLGLPSRRWDVDPDRPPCCPHATQRTAGTASARLPGLRLQRLVRRISAADCYTEPALLALRVVRDASGLYTFSGGSGGAAKTALAASSIAARQIGSGLESAAARRPGAAVLLTFDPTPATA
jgi:glycine/D-amino acid oxidase-like deaminating enzyme